VKETFKKSKEARIKFGLHVKNNFRTSQRDVPVCSAHHYNNINPDKIRDVIGPGGKMINKIIAETGVSIDIEDDGKVLVTSTDAVGMQKAVKWIEELTHEVTAGEVYEGTVVRIEDFGAFVQILPGKMDSCTSVKSAG